MGKNEINYSCPCCGYLTLSDPFRGSFEICPVCNWEDDPVQLADPELQGGANEQSLNEARQNFKVFKASARKYIDDVRDPLNSEVPLKDETD